MESFLMVISNKHYFTGQELTLESQNEKIKDAYNHLK